MMFSRRLAVAGVVVLLGGCGLFDALDKLKGLTFMLPTQTFTVSTNNANWRSPPASGVPPLPCGPGQPIADCCVPPAGAPAVDCTRTPLVCEAERCVLSFRYEEVKEVNLARDVPSLKSYNGMIFSQVLLKQIDLDVNNKLNVTTPAIDLFVAPINVTSTSMSGAQKIATIPMQAPGFMGHVVIPLDDQAQQIFSTFARATQTPFNIITSTRVLVKSGDPVPSGEATFGVGGLVEAKL
jgi:hypothetical protein